MVFVSWNYDLVCDARKSLLFALYIRTEAICLSDRNSRERQLLQQYGRATSALQIKRLSWMGLVLKTQQSHLRCYQTQLRQFLCTASVREMSLCGSTLSRKNRNLSLFIFRRHFLILCKNIMLSTYASKHGKTRHEIAHLLPKDCEHVQVLVPQVWG